jgi:hypothetical protein
VSTKNFAAAKNLLPCSGGILRKHTNCKFAVILGRSALLCGDAMIGFKFLKPSDSDVETIKRLIQIRCEMIDEAKKKK